MAKRNRAEVRSAVHRRIRRKVRGSTERPRLAVYRSLNHIYAQVIDDEKSQTLASASTTEKDLRGSSGGNVAAAKRVGQAIAERALSAGIDQVVFDRGGYLYHGRVRALTDAARAAGLNKDETLAREAEAAEKQRPPLKKPAPTKRVLRLRVLKKRAPKPRRPRARARVPAKQRLKRVVKLKQLKNPKPARQRLKKVVKLKQLKSPKPPRPSLKRLKQAVKLKKRLNKPKKTK